MSHLSGSLESGSLKTSLDGQEALQKPHSSYSFPSITYLSLPKHSAGAYSPAYTGRYTSLSGSRISRIRDLAGLLLLYFGVAWNAEQIISHALQPLHLSTSIFMDLIIFFFF